MTTANHPPNAHPRVAIGRTYWSRALSRKVKIVREKNAWLEDKEGYGWTCEGRRCGELQGGDLLPLSHPDVPPNARKRLSIRRSTGKGGLERINGDTPREAMVRRLAQLRLDSLTCISVQARVKTTLVFRTGQVTDELVLPHRGSWSLKTRLMEEPTK